MAKKIRRTRLGEEKKKDGRKQLGAWGESVAAHNLKAQGYRIVQRNWRCRHGEIDLVAQAGDTWVFVEVKTRRGRAFGTPEEGVSPHKLRKLFELGQHDLLANDLDDVEWRIDLVAVELDSRGKLLRCEHVPNIGFGW